MEGESAGACYNGGAWGQGFGVIAFETGGDVGFGEDYGAWAGGLSLRRSQDEE